MDRSPPARHQLHKLLHQRTYMSLLSIGDVVCFDPTTIFGGVRKLPKGILPDRKYTIRDIHYGLDGATSWDDLFFDELPGKFCEFDFQRVKNNG